MDAGIYTDMSNGSYHAQTDWVSSTQLKRLLPEFYPTPSAAASAVFDFGTAVHSRVLGGPSEPIQVVAAANWMSKAAKEERDAAYASGSIPILEKDMAVVEGIYDAVVSHSEAASLLLGPEGQSEVSVFAEVDGVPSKARFDRIVGATAVDLKTTSAKPGSSSLSRAVIDYGYDTSAAHYLEVARAAGIDLERFVLVFVEKAEPYRVTVCELEPDFLERGYELRDQALQRLLHPTVVDAYPGASGRLSLSPPGWALL